MKHYGDKIWEEIFSTQQWGKYPPEYVIRWFFWAKGQIEQAQIKALDLGCGIGACSWFMRKEGAKVTAIDGSFSALEKVNDLAQSFNVNNDIETIHGDITQPLTYLTEQYDLLLDNASLYSNEENKIHDALKDYQNIMNKNSYFLMNCFGEKSSGFGTGRQISNNTYSDVKGLFQNRGTVTFFTRERINEIIKELNYEIIYHSNLIENRGDLISEHLITVFKKRTLVR